MVNQGLGISNNKLNKIEVAKGINNVNKDEKKGNRIAKNVQNIDNNHYSDEKPCFYASGCTIYKGVQKKWVVDKETFPPEWIVDERISPKAKSLKKEKIDNSVKVPKKAMDKYPDDFFYRNKRYVKTIYS